MLQSILEPKRVILGYELKERIGSGGFGEVWSAIAPGGLMKAIKVVFGFHDESRAQAELKALDRVKQLRHPFMLSLERIEVFEGQLVVVTELADSSLADYFNEHATRGEPGIPRDELLKYLHCAAEALDYLNDEFQLQHLDIKPENLLLIGKHLKVADFGLIKDLHNVSQSMMAGMTPAYAAPELFDGRPSSFSDQYSLAIVYQEMLTGFRPFPGTTPAQLAAQHIHGKPNLDFLPKGDRPIIGKALAKDPELRFRSCRELAEELTSKRRSVKKVARRAVINRTAHDTHGRDSTSVTRLHQYPDMTVAVTRRSLPFQADEIKVLEPLQNQDHPTVLRPTLLIGVGATGNRILQWYKGKLTDQFGSMDQLPSVKIVCIDTDRQHLSDLRRSNQSHPLADSEVFETPLRKPEQYRQRSQSTLNWLNRRWIYNIPRSLQTEGLRPLGRLAFVEHFDSLWEKLESAIRDITIAESLATTAETLEMNPGCLDPRVVLVTSVSGGVGSGMALDLAYSLKLLLKECGFKDDGLVGVLLHSTYQRFRDAGLSAANSFAFLTEMRHYAESGYPGDSAIGLPDHEAEPPFASVYFNELGNDLKQSEFDNRLDRVAEYLLLSTTTNCSGFFDQCRELEQDNEHFSLRTFGLSEFGPGSELTGCEGQRRIGFGLVRRWMSGSDGDDARVEQLVERVISEASLNIEDIVLSLSNVVDKCLNATSESISQPAMESMLATPDRAIENLVSYCDHIFGPLASGEDVPTATVKQLAKIRDLTFQHASDVARSISSKLLEVVGSSAPQLYVARQALASVLAKLQEQQSAQEEERDGVRQRLSETMQELQAFPIAKAVNKHSAAQSLGTLVTGYCGYRHSMATLNAVEEYCRQLRDSLAPLSDRFQTCLQQIQLVAKHFKPVEEQALDMDESNGFSPELWLSEQIQKRSGDNVVLTEARLCESYFASRGGILDGFRESRDRYADLVADIRRQASTVLSDAQKKVSLEQALHNQVVKPEELVKWLNRKLVEARPVIDDCGGASRLAIAVPRFCDDLMLGELLNKHFGIQGCSIRATGGNFVICFEGEDLSLANVAFRLMQFRTDAADLASRVHTRKDINWVPLDNLF